MLYQYQEVGVEPGSELFLSTPSKLAESVLFYLHRCGRFICSQQYRIVRQNFNNYLVFVVDRGKMRIENEGRTFIAEKDSIGIINCHIPHAYMAIEDQTVFTWLHFSGSNTQDFYRHIIERHEAVLKMPRDCEIARLIRKMVDDHRKAEEAGESMVPEAQASTCIHDILCAMLFAAAEKGYLVNKSRNPMIEQAVRYIREHYMEPMEVNEIADVVAISRFHFTRMFKQEVGYTPHEYITMFRINRAKELLKGTNYSVAQISELVGYEYPTSFASVFQKRVGVTPKKFRDMII